MQVIDVWNVQAWDGGDRHNHHFYLKREAATEQQLKEWDIHGLFLKQSLIVLDSMEEIPRFEQEKIRQRALAKLTTVEREALGLKE